MLNIKGTNCTKSFNFALRQKSGSEEGHFTWTVQGSLNLDSFPGAADLVDLAKAVHLADRAIPRSRGSASRFRRIEITLPVREFGFWKKQSEGIERVVEFATGDAWRVQFMPMKVAKTSSKPKPSAKPPIVALFSGGLDSLCGAAYLTQKNIEAIYVSHSPPGFESNRDLICGVYEALGRDIPKKDKFVSFRLNVAQRHWKTGATMFQEMSRRTRPVYFLLLAAAVALVN